MNRIVAQSRVGADGVLHVTVPVGAADANQEVQITIEPASAAARQPLTQERWQSFLQSTAGAWQGDFDRSTQGEYEQRDELP